MQKGNYMWTKKGITTVLTLWDKKNVEEIAEELGVDRKQVIYIAGQMRAAGMDLSRKSKHGYLSSLIKEVAGERGIELIKPRRK